MAKYQLRLQARKLRSKGMSVKVISRKLGIAKSTASVWVRDIILSVEQLEKLQKRILKGAELGRIRGAFVQKEKRVQQMLELKREGIAQIGKLTDRELLLIGLALYWGEGSKKNRRLQFCNSDPGMIQFMLFWFKKCFQIENKDVTCRVGINEIHRDRDFLVKRYWAKVT